MMFYCQMRFLVVPNLSEEAITGAATLQKWRIKLNFEDDIVKGTCITHSGELYNERVKSVIENA